MKEANLTKQIRSLLKVVGIYHYKQHQGLGSTPGIADIIGIYKGRYLAIEIKGQGGRISPRQQEFIDRVNAEGGLGFFAWSVDDVVAQLGIEGRVFFQGRH